MKNAKIYYSTMCSLSNQLMEYLDKNNIKIKTIDVTKDINLQKEIYFLGGKAEVPMLYIDKEPIYGLEKIIEWIENNN